MWRQRVTGPLDPVNTPAPEIIDTLPKLLSELADALARRDDPSSSHVTSEETRRIATEHGIQRYHAGFSLGAVVREYGVLRECLFDLADERGVRLELGEVRTALRILGASIAVAVEQYTRERDEAIQRQSDDHFAFVAHELRNPLGTALLTAEHLRSSKARDVDRATARLLRSLRAAVELVDHTLVEVKLRGGGGRPILHRQPGRLADFVERVRTEIAGDAEDKGVVVRVEGSAPSELQVDQRLIHSAVSNLMRNAVKFTQPGGSVIVRLAEGEGLASVEVQDECGGLPAGVVEDLFKPYVQRGADRTGFGLGLAITRQAVEAHGGTIQAVDHPGRGCSFMFSLPLPSP